MKITEVTPSNVKQETLFCVTDLKNPGFQRKEDWFRKRFKEGLKIKILKDDEDRMISFIEFIPGKKVWRPVECDNYLFIHCMYTGHKRDRNLGYASLLISECEKEAQALGLSGICTMSSKGTWMTDRRIFEKCGFTMVDQKGRFELMARMLRPNDQPPSFIDWTTETKKYRGWNLIYADQCPWHEKSVIALLEVAHQLELDLQVTKINTPRQAKKAPSGFGTFSLVKDGKLLEDHYISATRFRNIVNKEITNSRDRLNPV